MKTFSTMLIIPAALFTGNASSQTVSEQPAGKVVYVQMVARQKDSAITQTSYSSKNMILYFGKQASAYQAEARPPAAMQIQFKGRVEDSSLVSKTRIMEELEKKLPGGTVARKASGSLIYREYGKAGIKNQQTFNGTPYLMEDTIPAINWKITGETKEIGGYACRKANGHFRGRNYEAWFATDIPVPAGPWKLGGLPGLILEATDSENEVMFRLQSITIPNPDNAVTINSNLEGEKITPEAYKEKVLKNIEQASKMITASGGRSSVNIQQLVPMEKDKARL